MPHCYVCCYPVLLPARWKLKKLISELCCLITRTEVSWLFDVSFIAYLCFVAKWKLDKWTTAAESTQTYCINVSDIDFKLLFTIWDCWLIGLQRWHIAWLSSNHCSYWRLQWCYYLHQVLLRSIIFVTSAEEGGYVFTSVCLSVHRITDKVVSRFWQNFLEGRAWPRDQGGKFWWRSRSPSRSRSPKSGFTGLSKKYLVDPDQSCIANLHYKNHSAILLCWRSAEEVCALWVLLVYVDATYRKVGQKSKQAIIAWYNFIKLLIDFQYNIIDVFSPPVHTYVSHCRICQPSRPQDGALKISWRYL